MKRWLKEVAEKVFMTYDGKDIVIGGPGMVKDKLVERLHPYVLPHVKRIESCGYTDENGLYEVMKKERYI